MDDTKIELQKIIEKKEGEITELKDNLKKMNPGFNPPTLDTIRAALTNGKFEFLRLEVDENSNLN